LTNTDYVVMGEGEFRFDKLLQYFKNKTFSIERIDGVAYKKNNGFVVQKVKYYIEDLDIVPFPDYSELDYQAYSSVATKYVHYIHPMRFPYGRIITSRGCPFDCIFCSSKLINGGKIRFRSAKSVLAEIDWLVKEYGVKEIIFYDDNLIVNRKRIVEILEGLIERNYDLQWKPSSMAVYALDHDLLKLIRKSGCYQLVLALESGTEEVLEIMKKPFRKTDKVQKVIAQAKALDFYLSATFVIGFPGETWDQILRTFRFAESLDIDYCTFNIATPLPKTELYEMCKKNNLLVQGFSFNDESFTGFGRPSIHTSEFSPGELAVLRAFEWDRINFKTKKQVERIALMNGICVDEVVQWRINTRRSALDLVKKVH
jgi:anaerobic magnesium-protoporphyrin IX monomethyl ester cyclase